MICSGSISNTDETDVDPEPFDVSNLTTPVVIDYKPAEAEIILVQTGSGLTPDQADQLDNIDDILSNQVIINEGVKKASISVPHIENLPT